MHRCAAIRIHSFQSGKANFIVHEHAVSAVGAHPDELPAPGFIERRDRAIGRLFDQMRRHLQFEFFAEHGAGGKQFDGLRRQQIESLG